MGLWIVFIWHKIVQHIIRISVFVRLKGDHLSAASKYRTIIVRLVQCTCLLCIDDWSRLEEHWTWSSRLICSLDKILVLQSYCFLAAWRFSLSWSGTSVITCGCRRYFTIDSTVRFHRDIFLWAGLLPTPAVSVFRQSSMDFQMLVLSILHFLSRSLRILTADSALVDIKGNLLCGRNPISWRTHWRLYWITEGHYLK